MRTLQQTAAELPQLTPVNGHATCLSTDVAYHFGKQHRNVLRDIENLLAELPDSHQLNFELMEISVEIGLGKVRKSPAYRLTRDGFTLLCMGFTGKRALQFKLAYIDAFNRMEQQLAQASHGQDARAARARFAPRIAYQNEDWFLRLCAWASVVGVSTLAYNLGVSRYTLSKVLHGRDGYGHGHWPHALAQLAQQGLPDQPPPFYPRAATPVCGADASAVRAAQPDLSPPLCPPAARQEHIPASARAPERPSRPERQRPREPARLEMPPIKRLSGGRPFLAGERKPCPPTISRPMSSIALAHIGSHPIGKQVQRPNNL